MRIGVLTGGGDCPGLNATLRGLVLTGVKKYGYEFVGFLDGWAGPIENRFVALDVDAVQSIYDDGGTILGSSRTNPLKDPKLVDKIKENLEVNNIYRGSVFIHIPGTRNIPGPGYYMYWIYLMVTFFYSNLVT